MALNVWNCDHIPGAEGDMIFCSKCKYFETTKGHLYSFDRCKHPNNLSYSHDWKNKWRMSIKHPRKINKKNNCKWFGPK